MSARTNHKPFRPTEVRILNSERFVVNHANTVARNEEGREIHKLSHGYLARIGQNEAICGGVLDAIQFAKDTKQANAIGH